MTEAGREFQVVGVAHS